MENKKKSFISLSNSNTSPFPALTEVTDTTATFPDPNNYGRTKTRLSAASETPENLEHYIQNWLSENIIINRQTAATMAGYQDPWKFSRLIRGKKDTIGLHPFWSDGATVSSSMLVFLKKDLEEVATYGKVLSSWTPEESLIRMWMLQNILGDIDNCARLTGQNRINFISASSHSRTLKAFYIEEYPVKSSNPEEPRMGKKRLYKIDDLLEFGEYLHRHDSSEEVRQWREHADQVLNDISQQIII